MYSDALKDGITSLQNDRDNGARVLATNAVKFLRNILVQECQDSASAAEIWHHVRAAGWHLGNARPSMGAAISSATVNALAAISSDWEKEFGSSWKTCKDAKVVRRMIYIGSTRLDSIIQNRNKAAQEMAEAFTDYLRQGSYDNIHLVRILTLSSSSSITTCLTEAIRLADDVHFEIRVLESRPRFEGAVFATSLANKLQEQGKADRVSITVASDSSTAMLAQNVDIVLLGADRISSSGDVSNKMGSLAVTLCAKVLSPACKVVVVSETDKIAKPGLMEEHCDEENEAEEINVLWPQGLARVNTIPGQVKISNVYFEWVPSKWINAYICEDGVLTIHDVRGISKRTKDMENKIFEGFSFSQ